MNKEQILNKYIADMMKKMDDIPKIFPGTNYSDRSFIERGYRRAMQDSTALIESILDLYQAPIPTTIQQTSLPTDKKEEGKKKLGQFFGGVGGDLMGMFKSDTPPGLKKQ